MSWYAWQNRLLADYIQWRFNKKIEALEHQNEEITYENVGWVRKMKIWKRRVRRSRLEKLSLTSPPEALRWVDTSELAGNPRTWDAWLPDWRCEGAADGDTHESCHLRELRPLCSSALGCPVQAPQCGLGCEWLAEPAVEMLSRGEQGQGGAPGVFLSPCQADSLPRAIVSASLQPSDLCTGSSFGCKGVSWKSSSQPYQAGVSQFRTLSTWKTHTQLTKNKNMHSNILVCESSPVVSWKFLQSLKTFQLLWNTSMSIASTSWSIWRYFPL